MYVAPWPGTIDADADAQEGDGNDDAPTDRSLWQV